MVPSSSVEFIYDLELPSSEEIVDSKISPTPSAILPTVHPAMEYVEGGRPVGLRLIPSNSSYGGPTMLPRLRRVTPFSKQAFLSYERTQAVENREPTTLLNRSLGNIQDHESQDEPNYENHFAKDIHGTFDYHHEGPAGVVSTCPWNEPNLLHIDSCSHNIDSGVSVHGAISTHFYACRLLGK